MCPCVRVCVDACVGIADKAYYNVSFRVKTTHDVTISDIVMTSMESPWPSYSAPSNSVAIPAAPSGAWQVYSVLLGPTTTSATDTRVTWWFDLSGKPDDVNVTFASASMLQVVPVHAGPPKTENLRVTHACLANFTATSVEACAATCLANGACVSFNYVGTQCELNQYAEGYTVVPEPGSQYWLRLESPEQAAAAASAVHHAVPYQLAVPTGSVMMAGVSSKLTVSFSQSHVPTYHIPYD